MALRSISVIALVIAVCNVQSGLETMKRLSIHCVAWWILSIDVHFEAEENEEKDEDQPDYEGVE